MNRPRMRRARTPRWCDDCDRWRIKPGQQYLVHTIFPGHDSGLADTAKHPVRLQQCFNCADSLNHDLFTDDEWRCRA